MIIRKFRGKKNFGYLVECKCDWCGKTFVSGYCEQTRRGKKKHFCCKACQGFSVVGKNNPMYGKVPKTAGLRGKDNHNWRGGKTQHSMGYIMIRDIEHPNCNPNGYVLEHRLVMEQHLGRYLRLEEVIHHIDKDITNNNISNLLLTNWSEHSKIENKYRKRNALGQYMGV